MKTEELKRIPLKDISFSGRETNIEQGKPVTLTKPHVISVQTFAMEQSLVKATPLSLCSIPLSQCAQSGKPC